MRLKHAALIVAEYGKLENAYRAMGERELDDRSRCLFLSLGITLKQPVQEVGTPEIKIKVGREIPNGRRQLISIERREPRMMPLVLLSGQYQTISKVPQLVGVPVIPKGLLEDAVMRDTSDRHVQRLPEDAGALFLGGHLFGSLLARGGWARMRFTGQRAPILFSTSALVALPR